MQSLYQTFDGCETGLLLISLDECHLHRDKVPYINRKTTNTLLHLYDLILAELWFAYRSDDALVLQVTVQVNGIRGR